MSRTISFVGTCYICTVDHYVVSVLLSVFVSVSLFITVTNKLDCYIYVTSYEHCYSIVLISSLLFINTLETYANQHNTSTPQTGSSPSQSPMPGSYDVRMDNMTSLSPCDESSLLQVRLN